MLLYRLSVQWIAVALLLIGVNNPSVDSLTTEVFNYPEEGDLYEGDIKLFDFQREFVNSDAEGQTKRKKRKFLNDPQALWDPKHIYYTIDSRYTRDERRLIMEALALWESKTCLRFVYHRRPVRGQDRFNIIVFQPGSSCSSYVGRDPDAKPQFVELGDKCIQVRQYSNVDMKDYNILQMGVISHEVAHALGFWHESSRPDRSRHLRVLYENVRLGQTRQFDLAPRNDIDYHSIPYDLGSVMHYRAWAYGRQPGLPTLEPRDQSFQRTMGQRLEPSFNDVHLMNKLYCEEECSFRLPCKNGGYTDPKRCNICRCPDGFGGSYCEKNERGSPHTCGGMIDLAPGDSISLNSPNFPSFDSKGSVCSWIITSTDGSHLSISMDHTGFNMGCPPSYQPCHSDYVEIKVDDKDMTSAGARFCCDYLPTHDIVSRGDRMVVIFRNRLARGRFRAQVYTRERIKRVSSLDRLLLAFRSAQTVQRI